MPVHFQVRRKEKVMLKNEKVPTAGQLSDLIGDLVKMITKIVSGLTAESVQRLIGRK
jgi:hypothetical protein